jgi:hypothetical protein
VNSFVFTTFRMLSAALLGALLLTPAIAADLPKPSPVPSPAELDIPYSADNPPGPQFSEEERLQQLAEGRRIRAELVEAFRAGSDSYTIPAGDYRFSARHLDFAENAFGLEGLDGNPNKPFRILGYGATFWFNLDDIPAPHYQQMIKIRACSHISLEGVTVDSDPRGCMDAKITTFDFEGNRIQVRPVAGTRLITQMPPHENRFIPYKANGHHIASLYQIDSEWGPGNVFYEKFERTEEGLYWLTLRNRKLLDTVRKPEWRAAYGAEGTLELGDMLGVIYSACSGISLLDCKQITVRNCRFHAAKAGIVERGGYGDHHWINCYFMARPGTNNLLGGDGDMSSCMHGSTFDGRVVQRTTDDCFNNHGRWNHAESAGERTITFRKELPTGLAPGHTGEAFDTRNDSHLGRLTVEKVEGKTVTFREAVGGRFASSGVMFSAFQNAGWVIRNSIFSDCYQRIRLCCGPGVFENNRVERVGSGLTLGNGKPVDQEGGLPENVVIRNNVFVDSAVGPAMRTLQLKAKGMPFRGLEVSGNVVVNSGSEALLVDWAEGIVLRDNVFIHPAQGQHLLSPEKSGAAKPVALVLDRVVGAKVSGNLWLSGPNACDFHRETACLDLSVSGNRALTGAHDHLAHRIRGWMEKHDMSARELIEKVAGEIRKEP